MKSGVYKITNLINNKCYIGSSYYVKGRISHHKHWLRKNKHHSRYLQNAWNKYGEGRFVFETIINCPIDELIQLEQYLMDYYQSEYNIRKIADSNYGLKRTDEQKQNISNSLKGRKISEKGKENMSKGKLKYFQENIVSQKTREKLRQANLGKKLSDEHREKLRISHLGYKMKSETKQKLRDYYKGKPRENTWQARPIEQIDLDTLKVINSFISVAQASIQTGLTESSIAKCARGVQKQAHGFIWRYV